MNVLIAVTNMTAANGGVTTHIIDLCRELCKRKNKVILLTDRNNCEYQASIEALEELPYFKFVHCCMIGIQSQPRAFYSVVRKMCNVVKQEKVDVIHTHSQSLCVVAACVKLMTKVPYIWTNHSDEIANPRLFNMILKTFHFSIISVSTDLEKMLINDYGVNEKRITVINNGVDVEKFAPLSEKQKKELKQKFGCGDKYVVGLLARMSFGKGHMYLLEAINKLQQDKNISNIKVLIAGKLHDSEKDYLEKLQTYAKAHKIDMSFLGFQNPREVFGVCDISILPSIYEGFPLTVIESLMMACPVIRSNTPGWLDTKDIALTFNKRDVDGLANHLYYAYTHPQEMKDMGQRGKKTVESRFTIGCQVDRTIEAYKKCMP